MRKFFFFAILVMAILVMIFLAGKKETPTYVGVSPSEVVPLREKCLSENPDALCLPLPFQPGVEGWTSASGATWFVPVPAGTTLVAVLEGKFSLEGWVLGEDEHRQVLPGQNIVGLQEFRLGWGEKRSYQGCVSGCLPVQLPQVELTLVKGANCKWGTGGLSNFQTEDVLILGGGGGSTSVGDPLLKVLADDVCLVVNRYEEEYRSIFSADDLLRNSYGTIVFVVG